MRKLKVKPKEDSVWRKELIPGDSVWRKELIPGDSIWRKDLFAFAGRRTSPCLACPILMIEDEHRCNKFNRIPDDIWDGLEKCPLYGDQ